jgi:hypothetical protein
LTNSTTETQQGVTKYQWLFSLFTAFILLALGLGMIEIGSSGTSLITTAALLAAFSSHNYLTSAFGDSSKESLFSRVAPF